MSYILSSVSFHDSLKCFSLSLCVIIKCIKVKFESIHIRGRNGAGIRGGESGRGLVLAGRGGAGRSYNGAGRGFS